MIGNGALALFKLKPAVVSLEGDKAVLKFADGSTLELASATGDATSGYTAKLTVGIAA